MEWSRVKTILICVFVVVNLLLVKVYIDGNKTDITVNSETIDNTVTVLAAENINIERELIPDRSSEVPLFTFSNKYKTCEELATELWMRSKSEGLDFFNPDSTSFENGVLTYSAKSSEKSVKSLIRSLKKTGLLDCYKFREQYIADGVVIHPELDGMPVTDIYCSCTLSGGTATVKVYNWLCDSIRAAGYSSVKTAPEALISFASYVKPEKSITITSVEKGFIAGDRGGELQSATVVPVWIISSSEGDKYYIDMRNGDLFTI